MSVAYGASVQGNLIASMPAASHITSCAASPRLGSNADDGPGCFRLANKLELELRRSANCPIKQATQESPGEFTRESFEFGHPWEPR